MDMNIIMNDSHIVSMWQVEESVKTAVVPTFSFDSHQQGKGIDSRIHHEICRLLCVTTHSIGKRKEGDRNLEIWQRQEEAPIQKDLHTGRCPTARPSRQCIPTNVRGCHEGGVSR